MIFNTSLHFFSDGRGVAIIQTPDYLEFVVSDGRNTWTVKKFLDKDLFSVWLYLAFRWRPESGLKLFINGRNEGEKVKHQMIWPEGELSG